MIPRTLQTSEVCDWKSFNRMLVGLRDSRFSGVIFEGDIAASDYLSLASCLNDEWHCCSYDAERMMHGGCITWPVFEEGCDFQYLADLLQSYPRVVLLPHKAYTEHPRELQKWLVKCFNVREQVGGLLHGASVTAYALLARFPFDSVSISDWHPLPVNRDTSFLLFDYNNGKFIRLSSSRWECSAVADLAYCHDDFFRLGRWDKGDFPDLVSLTWIAVASYRSMERFLRDRGRNVTVYLSNLFSLPAIDDGIDFLDNVEPL